MIFRRDGLDTEFLPPALEIEHTPASPLGRFLIWFIAFMVIAAGAWAYLGRVDKVAVARGRVVPYGEIKVIQPMREGLIKAIRVEEGQRVRKGQVLLELDPTLGAAEFESNRRVFSLYQSDKSRLLAELRGEPVGSARNDVPTGMTSLQQTLQNAKQAEYRAREEALTLIVSQRQEELGEARTTLAKLERLAALAAEREESYRKLNAEGIVPRMDLLEKQREFVATQHELAAQRAVVEQKVAGIEEARRNLDALKSERERTILTGLIDMEKSIAAVEGELTKARKEHEFDLLVSPVDGVVHELAAHTVGGVVKPAEAVATVVPDGTEMIVEAQALNTDIGFLAEGQEAEVKVDTFPFTKYGTVPARVFALSPDAVEDPKLGHVYRVKARLSGDGLLVDGRRVHLAPGMTVSLEVKTGKRRIIEFFLSPVVKYARESLTVR